MKEIPNKNNLIFTGLFKSLAKSLMVIFVFLAPMLVSAQIANQQNDDAKDQKSDVKTDVKVEVKSAKEIAKDLEIEKKNAKDIKIITDRINKNKDEYVVQIRTKFLMNADNLTSIANKIESRINKIEISGEDVTNMNAKLDEANKNIKDAKALLKTLPAKKTLLDYSDAKKYANTITLARNDLEQAKENLSNIISDLKDLVIDNGDEKN